VTTYIVTNAINGELLFSSERLDIAVAVATRTWTPCHVVSDDGMIAWDDWQPPGSAYDELMARRKKISDAWMDRVYHSKKIHGENSMMFWGAGIALDKDGTLRMIAFAPNSWTKLWELECREGGEVTFTEAT
jgi:hypothetical protein